MIVRALDGNGDWTFGKGKNNYLSGKAATAQNIQTRLSSFLGDCFFDINAGIDWFTFLGSKDALGLKLAINATILNTQDVTGIQEVLAEIDPDTRAFTVQYQVQTVYGNVEDIYVFDFA